MRTLLTHTRHVATLVAAACAPLATSEAPRPMPRPGPSGVYRSATEFVEARPFLAGSCGSGDHVIKIDARDDHAAFVVTHDGKRERVRKADVFGVRDCDGRDLRFIADRGYEVMAAGPLVLYRYTWRRYGYRNWIDSTAHYFSTSPTDKPIALTRMNLKRAFPTNHAFHDLLDLSFATDEALTAYDAFHGEYRLVRVLRLAQESACAVASREQEALSATIARSDRPRIAGEEPQRAERRAPPNAPIAAGCPVGGAR